VGSILSSKFEGGRTRSVATGHSVVMGEEEESDGEEEVEAGNEALEKEASN